VHPETPIVRRRRVRILIALGASVVAMLALAPGARATFPGTNGPIAFQQPLGVNIVMPDGTGLTSLNSSGVQPSFSPSGEQIAFSMNEDVFLMEPDGSDVTQLTHLAPSGGGFQPQFSPDAGSIVFSAQIPNSGAQPIYVMNADGSDQDRLTKGPAINYGPTYSPVGDQIAFSQSAKKIVTMLPNGGDQTTLAGSGQADDHPDYSPDGKTIAFEANYSNGASDIWVMDVDGTNATQLTTTGSQEGFTNGEPSFSPDGTRIVYSSDNNGETALWTMNVDGSNESLLVGGSAEFFNPFWGSPPVASRCAGQVPTQVGTSASDKLRGSIGRDVIVGRGGDDLIKGLDGADTICGGSGDDSILGQGGSDRLGGGSGDDTLVGHKGRDRCRGGSGSDHKQRC